MRRIVLMVDDNRLSLEPLEIALLPRKDLEVRVVSTAQEALTFLAVSETPVAAVVTDLHLRLSRIDGFELIEHVRAQPSLAHLPIIVISGDSESETPGRVKALGAAYFSKPYSPGAVRQALEQLLDVQQRS
ncbi:MAG: response regulator [Bryobacterales bacterium]|nr:response regulator [Bryobacterales bacterium]